jgi:hypothetical protein
MAVAYPGSNPTQAWANSLVDAVNAFGTGYQQWTGTIAAAVAVTAGNFRSLNMSVPVEFTGDPSPDLVLTWNGDCFSVPQDGHYEVTLQVGWDANSGGNRFQGLTLNPTGNTMNSGGASGAWKKTVKYQPTSDTVGASITWKGWLNTTDRMMAVARTTVAETVSNTSYETSLSVTFQRSQR